MKESTMINKMASLVLTIALVASSSMVAFGTSYDECKPVFSGWSVSVAKKANQVIVPAKTIVQKSNKTKDNILYKDSVKIKYSATFKGSLQNDLSASISAGTGKVSGGLGAAINTKFEFSGTVAKERTEAVSVTIRPKYKLTVTCTKMGDKITGHGKYYWGFGWEARKGTIDLGIPKYDDTEYKTTKI
ncbi:MAG: hypothetical protein LBG50_04065 [Clostridiales Family XIII bacterium]|jgi:hypothetical protein|nr:hypothetical protein [Clostridiales Family XIII bacterium]